MRRIIAGAALLVMLTTVPTAQAVDFRWTQEFAQGTAIASIRNENGSTLNLSCPSGQLDTTPTLGIETPKLSARASQGVYVQIVVDGKNHPFTLDNFVFKGAGRANHQALDSLAGTLAASKGRDFTVEFPAQGVIERFSLLNARQTIGLGATSILAGC